MECPQLSQRELPQYLIRVLVRILEVHLAVALVLVGPRTSNNSG